MALSRRPSVRSAGEGVSEVVGTLLILVMTVAMFSVIILWVYGFDTPEGEGRVNLFPTMERIDEDTVNVSVVHRGGEAIKSDHVHILLSYRGTSGNGTLGPFNYTSGAPGATEWSLGGAWERSFDGIRNDVRLDLTIADRAREQVVLRTTLQRGLGVGDIASPIVGVPVLMPDWEVVADGVDRFWIRAVAVDYDNDLPDDGVAANLRPIWNGLGSVTLNHRGFGIYESALITVPAAAIPGEYTLNVTATDSKGHRDTNWALVRVVSPDRTPPLVAITNPTSGEIAAGTARRIMATYTDANGIDLGSVTMRVYEDDIQLDTSAKSVTDTYVTFSPVGGFSENSVYKVNVSVSDNNDNVGYAETIFRMSTYSQPGNPQGETSFDVMNKVWVSTTEFEHDDYIRVQLWSEVIKQVDDSELRLTMTDSSNIYIYKDRFAPNLSVPPFSSSFPFCVYDATIDLSEDGAYGASVPPGYYTLKMLATYGAGGITYEDQIVVVIKYEDGSLPDASLFFLYNQTGRWSSGTRTFNYKEVVYIEVVTAEPLVRGKTTINKAIVSIADVYGDNVLYREIPSDEITYAGTGHGGYLYRMSIDLKATIDGSQWFYGANWYPIEVLVQTRTEHRWWFFWRWYSYDIEFEAGDQMKIVRPADLAIYEDELVIFHEDGTSIETNSTITFGEPLFVNLTLWNLGDVTITNARATVWAISDGVTLDMWALTSDANCWDPNMDDEIDSVESPYNYVTTNITWNTSRTGYDQATLLRAKFVVRVDIISPVIGGYGSDPVPEINYENNDATKWLVLPSDGTLTVANPGYSTPSTVDIGCTAFLADRLQVSASGGAVRVLGINVTILGTVQDSDIGRVLVYEDTNGNGALDGGDRHVASGAPASKRFVAPENKLVRPGVPVRYLALLNISSSAVAGRSLRTEVTTVADVRVEGPATVSGTGFPFQGDVSTVASNQNKLTGSGTGPASALAGSTTRYILSLDGKNVNVGTPTLGSLSITQLVVRVTAPGSITKVRLVDDSGKTIAERAPAATVTFPGLSYTVLASATRTLHIELDVSSTAVSGTVIGIQVTRPDVTLSSAQDSVDAAFSITRTSTVRNMAYFFEYKVGNPAFDGSDESVIQGINLGITDATVDVYIDGVTVTWTASSRPDYTRRVYVDSILRFEDDGTNHIANDQFVLFGSTVRLSTSGKAFRIEFNEDVISWGLFSGWSDNDITFTWHFTDGSTATGAKRVHINGSWGSYTISWQAI